MFCPNCGKEIQEKVNYCPECGALFHYTDDPTNGGQESSQYVYGDQTQQSYNPQYDQYSHIGENKVDEKSVPLCILSFLLPIVGIILFFCYDDDRPIRAKACIKWALAGFITNLVLGIIIAVLNFVFFANLF